MARFVIIDNWLDSVGGHNYQYAADVLQAAADAGFDPVLATAQAFGGRETLPSDWQVRPMFRFGWNRTHCVGVDGKRNRPIDLDGRQLLCPATDWGLHRLIEPLVAGLDLVTRRNRQRHINAFCGTCTELFDEIGFCSEDILFLPSVSEFDFLGLVNFLASEKRSQAVEWHVQFHYDIFDGRPPDHSKQQTRKVLLQRQFSSAISKIPGHQLHFYATTPQIAIQYDQLQIGRFQPLPYPASSALAQTSVSRKPTEKRLRVTMAGGGRREKGKHKITELLDGIHRSGQLGNEI